jgi:hypothetical protein
MVPGPVRSRTAPGTILLTSRFSGDRSVNCLGYSWISPGGEGLTHFVSSGTNHARKEPDRSRDSPVTLLHCSIRTRRIRTALATRRAQRGSPALGWRVRTAAGIRPANPFLAWIHGSVPQVQPRPDRAARSLIGSESTPAQVGHVHGVAEGVLRVSDLPGRAGAGLATSGLAAGVRVDPIAAFAIPHLWQLGRSPLTASCRPLRRPGWVSSSRRSTVGGMRAATRADINSRRTCWSAVKIPEISLRMRHRGQLPPVPVSTATGLAAQRQADGLHRLSGRISRRREEARSIFMSSGAASALGPR